MTDGIHKKLRAMYSEHVSAPDETQDEHMGSQKTPKRPTPTIASLEKPGGIEDERFN